MKTRVFICSVFCLALLLPGYSAESAATPGPPPADSGRKSPPKLKEGMAAAEIIKLVGKPDKVEPMPGTELKAEKWIYRRLVTRGTIQDAASVKEQPTFSGVDGNGVQIGSSVTPVYRLKNYEIYQVSVLLVVEGQLITAKQWTEREERFAD